MRFRAVSADGLLLWTGGDHFNAAADFLMLGLADGRLHYRFNLGNGEAVLIHNASRVDDGRWHRVRATRWSLTTAMTSRQNAHGWRCCLCRTEQTASLKVDNGHIVTGASPGKLRQLNGNGQIFIGT